MTTLLKSAACDSLHRIADETLADVLHVPASAHTLNGFRTWVTSLPEHWRTMFLGGEVFLDMSNEDIEHHVKIKGVIFATLFHIMQSEDLGEIYQDGGLLSNDTAQLACNPDAVAVLWKTLDEGRFQIVERDSRFPEMSGTPDWVLEVVSPSSVEKDTRLLRKAYHAAGIPEYWIVDGRDSLSLTILTWRKSGYVATSDDNGWRSSKVFGRSFRLRRTTYRGQRRIQLEYR